jgi:hypothetical protein
MSHLQGQWKSEIKSEKPVGPAHDAVADVPPPLASSDKVSIESFSQVLRTELIRTTTM